MKGVSHDSIFPAIPVARPCKNLKNIRHSCASRNPAYESFLRKQEPSIRALEGTATGNRHRRKRWIPAFAGMTEGGREWRDQDARRGMPLIRVSLGIRNLGIGSTLMKGVSHDSIFPAIPVARPCKNLKNVRHSCASRNPAYESFLRKQEPSIRALEGTATGNRHRRKRELSIINCQLGIKEHRNNERIRVFCHSLSPHPCSLSQGEREKEEGVSLPPFGAFFPLSLWERAGVRVKSSASKPPHEPLHQSILK